MGMSSPKVPLKRFTAGSNDDPRAGSAKCITCNRSDVHYLDATDQWIDGYGGSHRGHTLEILPPPEIKPVVVRQSQGDHHYYRYGDRQAGPFTDDDEDCEPDFDERVARELGVKPKDVLEARLRARKAGRRKQKKPSEGRKQKVIERPFGRLDPIEGTPFYEQAVVDGEICFITVDKDGVIDTVPEISFFRDKVLVVIRPRKDLPYPNYVIDRRWLDNPETCFNDEHWYEGKRILQTYINFTEPEEHAILSLATVKLSYLADWFESVPYPFAVGDTESGKTRWARLVKWLAYRPLHSESLPAADVYEFVTNSGSVVIEDEVQGLEKDPQKLKLYKGGYTLGTKVPRILINKSTGERRQVFFDSYGVKYFAGEDFVKNDGFMQRCLTMPFVKGCPNKRKFESADVEVIQELRGRLLALRILVAAGRVKLESFTSDDEWLEGRTAELYEPLLTVASPEGRKTLIEAAKRRYEERRAQLVESIEAKTVMAYLRACMDHGVAEVQPALVHERLLDEVGDIPDEYKPTVKSTGIRLRKLGFQVKIVRKDGKTVRLRYAERDMLDRLIRKYDLESVLAERKITLPAVPENQSTLAEAKELVTLVTNVTGEPDSKREVSGAPERPEAGNGPQDEPVTSVTTVTTATASEPIQETLEPKAPSCSAELDPRREAALRVLRAKQDGYGHPNEAAHAVMGVYPDEDEARLFVNHLTYDGLFLLDSDGRWRLTR